METNFIEDYLERVLACRTTLIPMREIKDLPFFVGKSFSFYSGKIFDREICFLIAKTGPEKFSLKELESALYLLAEKVAHPLVLIFASMTRRERLMLVKRHISFIVPGTQMFLPYLGIDFFDRIKKQPLPTTKKLRPAAQAILIEYLSDTLSLPAEFSVPQIVKLMNYSSMGTHRAVNQLAELKLCKIKHDGYRKTLFFDSDKKKIWSLAQPFLQSPVKKIIAIADDAVLTEVAWLYAGEYALALHSNLSPSRKCYAIHEKEYGDLLRQGKLHQVEFPEEGVAEVQIWRYTLPQKAYNHKKTVDLLSLELSLKMVEDPRVKIALLEIEENRTW